VSLPANSVSSGGGAFPSGAALPEQTAHSSAKLASGRFAQTSLSRPPSPRAEQIILFRTGGQLFAISSAAVQEVRSVDSLAGAASDFESSSLPKVRHVLKRGDKTFFVVNGAVHFGLPLTPGTLVFILRNTRTALLVDAIEKMTTMTRLQALPLAFCHEERRWYRGLTALDQSVVPVVNHDGFLAPSEISALEAALPQQVETAP
jgi:chemotaxis signal transduction protein